MKIIQDRLFALKDEKYRDFQCKLMPTVERETVIGVRTPDLRALAKELDAHTAEEFMREFPHRYYEENNLHGFLIERMKDYDACIAAINVFLPYVDNWATCDLFSPKVFRKNTDRLLGDIKKWIASGETYTVRFGLEMLMSHYLDGNFREEYLSLAAGVKSDEYYVNMMIAWFFATALAKQYDSAEVFIENNSLDIWTHNKAIQKAVESYRISDEQKAYLRSLKRRAEK